MKRSPAVDNLLFEYPEQVRQTMESLRELIFLYAPEVSESIKWNCPFYEHNGLLCYINFDRKSGKTAFAIVEGFLVEDKYLEFIAGQKQIRKVLFGNSKEIDEKKIAYYLKEAIKINKTKEKNFLFIRSGKG